MLTYPSDFHMSKGFSHKDRPTFTCWTSEANIYIYTTVTYVIDKNVRDDLFSFQFPT